jgi:hypothetical protein
MGAIACWKGADYFYATDFLRAQAPGARVRRLQVPDHYAPFGIQNLNGTIFVTYARQDAARVPSKESSEMSEGKPRGKSWRAGMGVRRWPSASSGSSPRFRGPVGP